MWCCVFVNNLLIVVYSILLCMIIYELDRVAVFLFYLELLDIVLFVCDKN